MTWKTWGWDAFIKAHPYKGKWEREEDAKSWADEAMKHHSDVFRPFKTPKGWEVEQDVP